MKQKRERLRDSQKVQAGVIFRPAIEFYMKRINYYTITLFMTIESSFIPFPQRLLFHLPI